MRKTFLLSTEHLEKALWFRDNEDFRVAMNYIAVQAAKHPEVVVLAFVLMSNHVHLVLYGTRSKVIAFITEFKRCYSIYYGRKYGVHEFLRENGVHIEEVTDENEGIEKAIAYVLDKPVAANICAHPSQYRWGTGNLYYNSEIKGFKRIGDLSARARSQILRTDCALFPGEWLIDEDGMILPSNYTNIKFVEQMFKSPRRMNYFLSNSSKAKTHFESMEGITSFTDQTVLNCLPDLVRSCFHKNTFGSLNSKEQSECVKQIRYRFNSDATQIARVCGISYEDAARLLDDFSC